MALEWIVLPRDVARVRAIVEQQQSTPLVQERINVNLRKRKPRVSRDRFWSALVSALLTSQQRSGPGSPVSRFIRVRPHPIGYTVCHRQRTLSTFLQMTLAGYGGIRFSTKLSAELASNYAFLQGGGW